MADETNATDEILSFAQAAISSVCALEILIYLRREQHRCCQPDELVREMRSSELAVAHALEDLTRSGLVVEIPELGYRYQQSSAQLDALCRRLEEEYARKPVSIVRAILQAPNEKLRIFADAFRLLEKRK